MSRDPFHMLISFFNKTKFYSVLATENLCKVNQTFMQGSCVAVINHFYPI